MGIKNGNIFICDNPNCPEEREWDASKGHVPPYWNMIRVEGEVLMFCAACSRHFDHMTADNGPDNISDEMKFDLGIGD